MLEVDVGVIDPQELLSHIQMDLLQKKVEDPFFSEKTQKGVAYSSEKLENQMKLLVSALNNMMQTYTIVEAPISSSKPIIGPMIVFAKRVVRKVSRWLWRPYWEQQNAFNSAALGATLQTVNLLKSMITASQNDK